MLPNLTNNSRLRITTLCVLYMAQGIPWGFVAITLPPYLAERGLPSAEVGGILALSSLPWSFKWLAGPLIDRFGFPAMGRRRPWILLAQAMMALTIGAMILIPDLIDGVKALGMMVFVHNCFNALQDVSVDALAVDLLEEEERGKANGFMYGSKYVGGWLGGAGLASILAATNMQTALLVQTSILLCIMTFPLLLRERAGERLLPWTAGEAPQRADAIQPSVARLFRRLGRAFSLKSTISGVGLALMTSLGAGILSVIGAVFFTQRLGWTGAEKAMLDGWAVWLGLAGSIGGGWVADRVGAKAVIATGALGLAGVWLGFALLEPFWTTVKWIPIGLLLLEPLLQSVMTVGLFALFMSISWPKVAATQFTAYMALLNLSTTIGHWLAGPIDEVLDFQGLYFVGGALQASMVLLLPLIDMRETRRVLGDEG
ncbi:MAG: MFS transporter [Myxococcales bacterium]|nr:MFS transporter [Myxococcales bacterium]